MLKKKGAPDAEHALIFMLSNRVRQFPLRQEQRDVLMDITLGRKKNRTIDLPFTAKPAAMPRKVKGMSLSIPGHHGLMERVAEALRKTQAYYVSQQHTDGYWRYELESNVTITAEYLMLLRFLGLEDRERDRKMANHILKNQRTDGTWSIYWGGKGDISTTAEAYFALKLAGFSSEEPALRKARAFIHEKGGVETSRVFTRIFLALFGEFDWRAIPSIPVEINILPAWFPISIYNFSSWARSTIVPLSMILARRPVRPLPESARIQELYKEPYKVPPVTTQRLSLFSWKRFFIILDRMIKSMEAIPAGPLRKRALQATERWLFEHQEPTGDWGGIQPAMVNSIIALSAMGYDVSNGAIKKGLDALERFTIERDDEIVLQSCISPVWDTALTALAMLYSGMEREHRSLVSACSWLTSKQIFQKGDWSIKRPHLRPGGWAFEFENSRYPDVDDTAVVLMLLNRYEDKEFIKPENMESGLRWILGMQGKDGGWGAFDVDNNMRILNQLPFGDLEAMIDPSTPDLTGRVLELLGLVGYRANNGIVRGAIEFLKRKQEESGPWWGRWGVNYIYGTSAVLVGLGAVGEDMSGPYVKRAVKWLKDNQHLDGGWGECCESYEDPTLKCCGTSTPSQTAWAILGLLAAGEGMCEEVIKGVSYLLKRQSADGTWDEQGFTGTGFPKYFMIRYHNYRNCFPLMALGRFYSQHVSRGTRK
ncbi:MAG: squalene--hopene cyclase [Nitrospirae bacterium]|nr:squalene--hopene cyclase [Nitrospirota bacterium]